MPCPYDAAGKKRRAKRRQGRSVRYRCGNGPCYKLTDPADPNKVVGYAFVEQVHYLAADDDSDDAKAAIAGVAGLFTDGPVLDAVALPGQQRATRAYFAEIGSGKADFA